MTPKDDATSPLIFTTMDDDLLTEFKTILHSAMDDVRRTEAQSSRRADEERAHATHRLEPKGASEEWNICAAAWDYLESFREESGAESPPPSSCTPGNVRNTLRSSSSPGSVRKVMRSSLRRASSARRSAPTSIAGAQDIEAVCIIPPSTRKRIALAREQRRARRDDPPDAPASGFGDTVSAADGMKFMRDAMMQNGFRNPYWRMLRVL